VRSYDVVAAAYADELLDELDRKPFDRWLLERVAALAGGAPVADVGCGPGQVAAHLALAGADVTGIDLSPGMVEEARRRFPELPFEVGDLAALPPGRWAAVTAWYSLVHLAPQELPGAIDALVRAVRPGGWLAFAVHEGEDGHHLDEWWGHAVEIDFVLHRRADVLAAVDAAGLDEVEWYLRGPSSPTEARTDRLYVLGRRPASS
jgi:SAM-dependent methyltransferase